MKHVKHWNIVVKGKVQGVSYRLSTKAVADQLNVKGFVFNQPDGTVYIEAEGDTFALDSFKEWCEEGPDKAEVEEVDIIEGAIKNFSNFEVVKKAK